MKVTLTVATMVALVLSAGQAAAQAAVEAVKGFSIVLVEGSQQPGTSSDLPAPAKAAIEDIKDFLPFKSFRLLDASWIVGTTDVRSRLNGGERDYDVGVKVQAQNDANSLSIKFLLRDVSRQELAPPSSSSSEMTAGTYSFLRAQLEDAYRKLESARQKLSESHPDVQAAQQTAARLRDQMKVFERLVDTSRQARAEPRQPVANTALIETSFSMRVGETVVVGTSRVNGERALIALMTAVSK